MSTISFSDHAGSYTITTNLPSSEIMVTGSTFSISTSGKIRSTSGYIIYPVYYEMNYSILVDNSWFGLSEGSTGIVGQGVDASFTTSAITKKTSTYFNTNNPTTRSLSILAVTGNYGGDYYGYHYTHRHDESGRSLIDYNGVCERGTLTLNAPPSCDYSALTDTSSMSTWTQGMSVARVTISDAAAQYGGYISNVKLIVGTNSASISGNGNIDVPILDSGTLTPQIVVTDSRGQTTSYTLNPITVMAYQKPSIESIELERHIPSGEQDETQVYISATIKQSVISGNSMGVPRVYVGQNEITNKILWYNEPEHTTRYTSTTAANKVVYGMVNSSEVFATGLTYTFLFTISDAYSTSESKTETLPTIFITMDFQAQGKEIAFGAKADDDVTEYNNGLFKCAMSILNLPMVGEIKMWAGQNIPTGWLLCDGSEVKKTDYPYLYEAIGDIWGVASSSLKFKLPNLTGRVPVGIDANDDDTKEILNRVGAVGGLKYQSLGALIGACNNNSMALGYPADGPTPYQTIRGASYVVKGAGTLGFSGWNHSTPVTSHDDPFKKRETSFMQPYAVVKFIICAY